MAESSVKRMFAKGDMPLKRIDEICRVLKCDFSELARKVADLELLRDELSAGAGAVRSSATSDCW